MKIVVIGGTGLIGSQVVKDLQNHGHEAIAASPNTGVNTLTGEGLAEAFDGASVVIDVSNSPSFEDGPVMEFFQTATRNILDQAAASGVGHLVALSIVGTEDLPDSGYLRAKTAQEKLIKESAVPYSIVHATQFFEFLTSIADAATVDGTVRLPSVLFQPVASADVAATVSEVALAPALMGTVELGGPEKFHFDELIRMDLQARGDARQVVGDPQTRYFGTELQQRSLIPQDGSRLGQIRYADWFARATGQAG